MYRQSLLKSFLSFSHFISPPAQALAPGGMQTLPKRPILEKSNGAAAAVFNPSMFHYQQALANMQLQQPAFIPTGESFSAATTSGSTGHAKAKTSHLKKKKPLNGGDGYDMTLKNCDIYSILRQHLFVS